MPANMTLSRTRRALRRSPRTRVELLLALDKLGQAYTAELARAAGLRADKVRLGMFGDREDYARNLSLVPLGLVRAEITEDGLRYTITRLGRRVAAALRRELIRELLARPRARV